MHATHDADAVDAEADTDSSDAANNINRMVIVVNSSEDCEAEERQAQHVAAGH